MEFDNILDEKIKVKRKYTLPLIIIGILIVILAGIGSYLYFTRSNPKTVYTAIIDEITENVSELFEDMSETSEIASMDFGFAFDLKSNSEEYKSIASILNKLKLNMNVEADMNSKKANMNYGLSYKDENMIDVRMFVNKVDAYADLGSLYNKPIKLSDSGIEQIWETIDCEDYKVIIHEFANILKENLKDEYFTSSKEKLEIFGKKVNVTKNTLTLANNELEELLTNTYDDIANNDKLITSIVNITEMSKENIKQEVLTLKENLEIEENTKLVIDIYQRKLDIVKIIFTVGDSKVVIEEVKANLYEISIVEGDINDVVASITLNDNETSFVFNYNDVLLEIKILDEEALMKIEVPESILEFKMNKVTDGLIDGYIRIYSGEEDFDLKVNFTVEEKNIVEVVDMNITNYIELENMTDEDYNLIMEKITQSSAVMSLVEDFLALDSFSSLMMY